jgi:hypothetical protein
MIGFFKPGASTRFHPQRLGASLPCLFPPMAEKFKPPAVRLVVDSKTVSKTWRSGRAHPTNPLKHR